MRSHLLPYCALICLLLLSSLVGKTQDIHFTQFQLAPHELNPALAGVSVADLRFGAILRDQWRTVPVPYTSVSLFFDQKNPAPILDGQIGWGGSFTHDRAGDGRLSWSQASFFGAFHYPLGDGHMLDMGLTAKIGQRAIVPESLNWGDQYDGEQFNPNQVTAEQLTQTNTGYLDFDLGLGYHYFSPDERTRLHAGLVAGHLNQPVLSFLNGIEVPLAMHFRLYTFGQFRVNEQWVGTFRLLARKQGAYQEYLGAIGAGTYLEVAKKETLYLGVNLGYRLSDAASMAIEGRYQNWVIGFNYDVNTSSLQEATRGRGGPELAIQYLIYRPKPPEEFKACPIF